MASRRSNNEGSIYHRKDGLWCAQVSQNGKFITKYAQTPYECRHWIKVTLHKIEHGLNFDGAQVSMERYLQSWKCGRTFLVGAPPL